MPSIITMPSRRAHSGKGRRHRPGQRAVRKCHSRAVRERQFATGRRESAPDKVDYVVHALGCLGERVLVQEPRLAPDLADPFSAAEHQRAGLDLDEQHPRLRSSSTKSHPPSWIVPCRLRASQLKLWKTSTRRGSCSTSTRATARSPGFWISSGCSAGNSLPMGRSRVTCASKRAYPSPPLIQGRAPAYGHSRPNHIPLSGEVGTMTAWAALAVIPGTCSRGTFARSTRSCQPRQRTDLAAGSPIHTSP